jgi:hypothetical protein
MTTTTVEMSRTLPWIPTYYRTDRYEEEEER